MTAHTIILIMVIIMLTMILPTNHAYQNNIYVIPYGILVSQKSKLPAGHSTSPVHYYNYFTTLLIIGSWLLLL